VRSRGIVQTLARELFASDLALPDFPRLKSVRILGISDSEDYGSRLGEIFDYRNTFYHQPPRFDVRESPESGSYDFVICSEVLEHVTPPIEEAFRNLWKLLKDDGILILTVPYTLEETAREHFPQLHDFGIARLRDRLVLVNRTASGELQVFDDLVFHGGHGDTLELRVFSEATLRNMVLNAGFRAIEVYAAEYLPFGIARHQTWSLPIAARKSTEYRLAYDTTGEFAKQWVEVRGELGRTAAELLRRTDWAMALDRKVKELEPEFEKRTEWALSLQQQLNEKIAWAADLSRELEASRARVTEVEREFEERTKWALALDSELNECRTAKANIEGELNELRRRQGRIRRRMRRLFGL